MADDDTMVVTIEPDAPAAGGEDAAVAEVSSQFAEMKTRTERAEADRAAALRRANVAEAAARDAKREAETQRAEVIDTQAETVDSGIAAATDAVAAAKKEIKAAGEAGDHDAQADAYDRLATARARLERLSESKSDIAARKAEAARPTARKEEPAASGDPFDDYLTKFTAPTADWMRSHKEWVTDPRKSLKLEAADRDARAEGLAPDSAEYFEHVETFIGLRKDATPEPAAKAATNGAAVPAKATPRRAPVAPVQASTHMNGGTGETVRLSKKQADAATDGTHVWNYADPTGQNRWKKGDPIGIQEMARRVKEQTAQGLYRPENAEI